MNPDSDSVRSDADDRPDTPDGDAAPEHEESGAESTESLGRSAALSTLWLTSQKWLGRVSGLVTIAILTRLISPEEFGIVAAASTITAFIWLLGDSALSAYLVQVDKIDQRVLSTGFWFSLGAGFTLAAIIAGAAPLIASAFGLPAAVPVLRGLSVSALILVVGSVPWALLKRAMRFRELALMTLVGVLVGQVVAIVLAFRGAGAWALVLQLIANQIVCLIWGWKAAGWRPGFQFSKSDFITQVKFSSKVLTSDSVATIRLAAEAAIISNVLGAAALGYLNIAERLVQVAKDLSAAALVPVSTVVFAKIRDSAERLRAGYLKALGISYSVVAPIMTVIIVGGPLVVPLLFGGGWEPSVPVAQALALAAMLTLGSMLDNGLHFGVGRPGRWLAYTVFAEGLAVAVTAAVAHRGLQWIAIGFVIVAFLATIVRWVLVGRLIDVQVRKLAGIFFTTGIAVAGSAVAGFFVRHLTTGWPPFWALAAIAITIGVVHVVLVRLVSPGVFRNIVSLAPLPAKIASRIP